MVFIYAPPANIHPVAFCSFTKNCTASQQARLGMHSSKPTSSLQSTASQRPSKKMSAASNFLRLYEQLRAVWKSKDKEQPFVRGYLLTKAPSSPPGNGYLRQNGGKDFWRHSTSSAAESEVAERWFTLLGHALFYCTSKESQEYGGAMLTDIFSPVMARVDDQTMKTFGAPESLQVRE